LGILKTHCLWETSFKTSVYKNSPKGNPYAKQLLHSVKSNRHWSAAMGSIRLLHHLARMLQNRLEDERKDKMGGIDRKLKRKIDEKKQAHGLKQ